MNLKQTNQTLRRLKGKRPLVAVTAYDYPTAVFADRAGVDLILVGDSVGTTQLGMEHTVGVTLEMMIHHCRAVARARPSALLTVDLPFGWAHAPLGTLIDGCRRLFQEGGCEAVKLEGGEELAPAVATLVASGMPVLGHVGLLPQSVNEVGGYRKFGKSKLEAEHLLTSALALEEAGVFAIVLEMVEGGVAADLSTRLQVPVIGIGSGPECDGQILVSNDLLGLNPGKVPAFVRVYEQLGERMTNAFAEYARHVREGVFPKGKKR